MTDPFERADHLEHLLRLGSGVMTGRCSAVTASRARAGRRRWSGHGGPCVVL